MIKKIAAAAFGLFLCAVNAFGGYLYGRHWVDMKAYAAGYDDGFYSSKSLLIPNTTIFDATTKRTFKIIEVESDDAE